jgi:hypothetical protein
VQARHLQLLEHLLPVVAVEVVALTFHTQVQVVEEQVVAVHMALMEEQILVAVEAVVLNTQEVAVSMVLLVVQEL